MDYKMAAAEFSKSNKHALSGNTLISRCWGFFYFDFLLMLGFVGGGEFVLLNPTFPLKQPCRCR